MPPLLWFLGLALAIEATSNGAPGDFRRYLSDYDMQDSEVLILEDRRQRVDVIPDIDWGAIGSSSREGLNYCVPLQQGGGCTMSPSRMSFLMDAVRNTQHASHYKEFALHEMQCRRRSFQNCGAEGIYAYMARSQASQDKPHFRDNAEEGRGQGEGELLDFGGRGIEGMQLREQEREETLSDGFALASAEVGKCRWNQDTGCVAHESRITMDTFVDVCKIELVQKQEDDVTVLAFEEEFSFEKVLCLDILLLPKFSPPSTLSLPRLPPIFPAFTLSPRV
jgi:hypothetical protein